MKHNNDYNPVARAVKFALAASLSFGITSTAVQAQDTPTCAKLTG